MQYSSKLTENDWHIEDIDADSYLQTIGIAREIPSASFLAKIHRAHVHTFTFANIDVLLDQHPGVNPAIVQEQVQVRRRGGYCFEHGQLLASILQQLGFTVTRHLSRVHSAENTRTHLCLAVEVDGKRYLCDPGFGFSIETPLIWEDGATSTAAGQTFKLHRIVHEGSTYWELRRNEKIEHVIDELPVVPADVRTGHFITSQEPLSVFRQHLMVLGYMGEKHYSITEKSLTIRQENQETKHQEIDVQEALKLVQALGVRLSEQDVTELTKKFAQN